MVCVALPLLGSREPWFVHYTRRVDNVVFLVTRFSIPAEDASVDRKTPFILTGFWFR